MVGVGHVFVQAGRFNIAAVGRGQRQGEVGPQDAAGGLEVGGDADAAAHPSLQARAFDAAVLADRRRVLGARIVQVRLDRSAAAQPPHHVDAAGQSVGPHGDPFGTAGPQVGDLLPGDVIAQPLVVLAWHPHHVVEADPELADGRSSRGSRGCRRGSPVAVPG